MSLICPSSSHQLAAAATAFQRARRKFPKNLGLRSSSRESSKGLKVETLSAGTANKTTNHGSSTGTSPTENNAKLNYFWSSWANDNTRENKFSRENTSTRPETACGYCQRCHDLQVYDVANLSKKQCSDVDDNDSLVAETTTRELYDKAGTASMSGADCRRLRDEDRCEAILKSTHSSRFKAKQCGRHRSCVHERYAKRLSKKEDFVDRFVEADDNDVVLSGNIRDNHNHHFEMADTTDFPKKLREWERRTRQKLPTKLERLTLRRVTTSPVKTYTRIHSSNIVSPRFTYSVHGHRHRHHQCHRHRNNKQISPRSQDRNSRVEGCLRPSIVRTQQRNVRMEGEANGLITTLPEERGDDVIVINHKNSMELLAEKFKIDNKFCRYTKNRNATTKSKSRIDESQVFPSEIVDLPGVDDVTVETLRDKRSEFDDVSRYRGTTVMSVGKMKKQMLKDDSKNLRYRSNGSEIHRSPNDTPR